MKCPWWVSGLAVALLAGCGDQTLENMQKAAQSRADEAAAEATAAVERAGEEAVAKVEVATEEGKATVESATEEGKAVLEGTTLDLTNLKIGDIDVGKELGSLTEQLNTSIGEIKDVETAKAALPQLEQTNVNLDKLVALIEQIPEVVRPALASAIKTHSAKIEETVKKVVAIEGVGEIVKPVLDEIVAKLSKVGEAKPADAAKEAPAPYLSYVDR
jgi:hypothetical protein